LIHKKSLEDLANEELKELLEEKKESYKDIEEEMEFVLSQTGIHLPGNTREKYDNRLQRVQKDIDRIKEILED
jgi:archaellum component FlaC